MFHQENWVKVPLAAVFRFFANPANLPRIMPPQTGATLLQKRLLAPPLQAGIETQDAGQLAGAGSEIVVSFRLFPHLAFRMKWVSRLVEFEIDQYFVDVQARGPFKFWRHRHEFLPADRDGLLGTTIRDIVEYEVGFGPAGDLADRTFVWPQLRRTFEFRKQAAEHLLQDCPAAVANARSRQGAIGRRLTDVSSLDAPLHLYYTPCRTLRQIIFAVFGPGLLHQSGGNSRTAEQPSCDAATVWVANCPTRKSSAASWYCFRNTCARSAGGISAPNTLSGVTSVECCNVPTAGIIMPRRAPITKLPRRNSFLILPQQCYRDIN